MGSHRALRPGEVVKDRHGSHYTFLGYSDPDRTLLHLRNVITKKEYVNVPHKDVELVPGLVERR